MKGITERRVASIVWALLVLIVYDALLLLGRVMLDFRDPVAFFYYGVVATLVFWYGGTLFAGRIVHNYDVQFFYFTPLSPSLFHRRAWRRIALPFAAAYVAAPLILLFWTYRFARPAGRFTPATFHLLANLILVVWCSFALPFHDMIAGRKAWTTVWIPLRFPIRRLGRWASFIVVGLILTGWLWGPWLFPLLGTMVRRLLDMGLPGEVAAFLFAPIWGVFALHSDPSGPGPWLLTAFCLFSLARCALTVARASRKPMTQYDQDLFHYWTEVRERIETSPEFDNGAEPQLVRPVGPRAELATDEDESLLHSWERPHIPAYMETLSPERQVLRHWERGQPIYVRRHFLWLSRIHHFCVHRFWLVFVLGMFFLWFLIRRKMMLPDRLLFLTVLEAGALFSGAVRGEVLQYGLRTSGILPLQWPRLILLDFFHFRRHAVVADLLAAVLGSLATRTGLAGFVALALTLFLFRMSLYLMAWLKMVGTAGRRWARVVSSAGMLLFFGITLLLWVGPIFTSWDTSIPVTWVVVFAMLANASAFALFAAVLVLVLYRRIGTAPFGFSPIPHPTR